MTYLKDKVVNMLEWLGKYTKIDMLYLVKGSMWGSLSQISTALMALGLAAAFSRLVPKEVYGQYKYVLSIINLLSTFSLTGLSMAVLQSVSAGYEGTVRYAFWQNIKWSVFFFLGSGIVSVYYFLHSHFVFGFSMLLAGCLWPIFISTNLDGSLLMAKKDFRRVTIYFDVIGNLVPYLSLFGIMFLTQNPIWFVAAYIISNTVIGLILYQRTLSIYKPNDKVEPGMLGYSKHLSIIGILMNISDNVDQILVFHYIGAAELAIYNFATAIPDQIKGPVKNLVNLLLPKFTERTDKEIHPAMNNKFLLLFIAGLTLSVGYIVVAPYIYKIFFPQYIDSVLYSQIFSLSMVSFVGMPAFTYMNSRKKIKELYVSNVSTSLLSMALVFISIVKWGLIGLVIVRVLMRIIAALVGIFLYKRSIKTV